MMCVWLLYNTFILFYSPFQVKVKPRVEPKKVKIDGPAIGGKGIPASFPTELIIDASQAGYGDLEVQVVVS